MEEFLVRYIHFIGVILLASMLMVTNFMISSSLSKQELSKLLIIDRVYGASAMLTLFAGVT
jgi:putative membrane protein